MFRRIGTKLYAALGLAVLLTLLSSGVGVWYFEVSGDLSHGLARDSFPALEDAWLASDVVKRLTLFGEGEISRVSAGRAPVEGAPDTVQEGADRLVEELRTLLPRPGGLHGLSDSAEGVLESSWAAVDVLSSLDATGPAMNLLRLRSDEIREMLSSDSFAPSDYDALLTLHTALSARDTAALDVAWDKYGVIAGSGGPSEAVRALAEGDDGVFAVRQSWLTTFEMVDGTSVAFGESAGLMRSRADALVAEVSGRASAALEGSVASFDQGRLLLFAISAAGVVVATLTAWLWVGNMVVRRLSRLSARMKSMASGDLDTPVPEIGNDEIGELADALEVFRRQALEVQRLNLVERLYGELGKAYQELKGMQARLVAQEKLAALGGIVSGVAHEISNPLNFVKNFSEGSGELTEELFEMLDGYREQLAEEDKSLLDEIRGDLSDSLKRVQVNGARALTIVQRMQSLGMVGGEPSLHELRPVVNRSVRSGCDVFGSEWGDFLVEAEFDWSELVGKVAMVPGDFNEAVVNLVTNACYAMRVCREAGDRPGYEPRLLVSTRLEGDLAAVVVSDNGTGIADDILPSIFDPFFTTRDGALGAGLGLPLAADVARRGGGDLTVETEVGRGSVFTLTVPLALAAGPDDMLDDLFGDDAAAVRSVVTAETA